MATTQPLICRSCEQYSVKETFACKTPSRNPFIKLFLEYVMLLKKLYTSVWLCVHCVLNLFSRRVEKHPIKVTWHHATSRLGSKSNFKKDLIFHFLSWRMLCWIKLHHCIWLGKKKAFEQSYGRCCHIRRRLLIDSRVWFGYEYIVAWSLQWHNFSACRATLIRWNPLHSIPLVTIHFSYAELQNDWLCKMILEAIHENNKDLQGIRLWRPYERRLGGWLI
jgi:hypothetical protein